MVGGINKVKTLFALLAVSFLFAGCVGQPSGGAPQATAFPAPGSAEAQALPLEQAKQAMVEEMQRTGGDAGVARQQVETDSGFRGTASRSGKFERIGYMTDGSAALEEKDGKTYVVFSEDFSTPNGPDLVVYLTKNMGETTREDVRGGVQLAELKSIKGKQVYEIPAGVDAAQYTSVTIHCRAFNVPWSYAPLK